MLKENGYLELKNFDRETHSVPSVMEIEKGVWFAAAVGHSNAIFIEGDESVILIDPLDTLERGQKLRCIIEEKCHKPVRTIIYTHGHPDHRGGAGAFKDEVREIIAFKPVQAPLFGMERLGAVFGLRARRQFGYGLSDEEAVSQGLGPREGSNYGEHPAILPPTLLYDEAIVHRNIDGIELELIAVPGETDDQAAVWLPDKKVLCCGDDYYGCFPNLYAIRGGQYRDIAQWIKSLDKLMSYPAEHLLPGHTKAISGHAAISEVLGNYKAMMEYILDETLKGINEGKTADELASEIRLPEELLRLPYLGEYYGSVEWTVREIYAAYMGWFDGDPAKLHPLPVSEKSSRYISLMGGYEKVLREAEKAYENAEYQLSLELCTLLSQSEADGASSDDPSDKASSDGASFNEAFCKKLSLRKELLELKARALLALADMETSANGRHYYIACAKEAKLRSEKL